MVSRFPFLFAVLAIIGSMALTPAQATIVASPGIDGFNSGFTLNNSNGGAASINDNTLQITVDGDAYTANSAFYGTPQSIGAFTASFTYQAQYDPSLDTSGLSPEADGATFVLQNDPSNVNALGYDGSDLGYSNQQDASAPAIHKSVAIAFNIYSGHVIGTNLLIDGKNPGFTYASTGDVNLQSNDPIDVVLSYQGDTLTESLTDEVTEASFTTSYTVDIPGTVAGNTAYVGFTGATGGGFSSQYISNFVFSSGPALTINPNPVLGGKSATGTITLSSPVASQTLVRLSSSDPTNASVKNTIYISAGHSTVNFAIATQGVQSSEDVTITAQLMGGQLQGALQINSPNLIAAGIQLDGNPVVGGNYVFASVNVSSPAPAGGLTVTLGAKNNSYGAVTGFWSAPPGTPGATSISSVTIPAGATSAEFVVNTENVPQSVNITIQGTLNGVTRGAVLNVIPPPAT